MHILDLYVYEGEEFSRVLAKADYSPTGFTSMTGAFPTPNAAIDILIETRELGEGITRFWNLEGTELLREYAGNVV